MIHWSLRLRVFLFFALIIVGSVVAGAAAVGVAVMRVGEEVLPDLVLAFGVGFIGFYCLVLWIWLLFDENVARPIMALSHQLRTAVHADALSPVIAGTGKYLGLLGPTVEEISKALVATRRSVEAAVTDALGEAARREERLATIIRDLPHPILLCNKTHQVVLYNRRLLEHFESRAEVGLGRPVFELIPDQPLRSALAQVAQAKTHGVCGVFEAAEPGGAVLRGRLVPVAPAENGGTGGYIVTLEGQDQAAEPEDPARPRPEFYDFDLFQHPVPPVNEDSLLMRLSYVVFDTETTGLRVSRGDQMVELAGVRVVNGRVLEGERFEGLANPQQPIPRAATRFHGIDDRMVADAPDPKSVAARFQRFAEGAVLVAHNALFDLTLLDRNGEGGSPGLDRPHLCTVLLAAHLFGGEADLSLKGLAARFGVPFEPYVHHTALGDAMATAGVLLGLLRLLEADGVTTLGKAMALSQRQSALRRAQRKAI